MRKIAFLLSLSLGLPWMAANAQNDDANRTEHLNYWLNMDKNLAGEEYMTAYEASMDSLDIAVSAPVGFTYIDVPIIFCPDGGLWDSASILGPAFESEAKDAVIAFPLAIDYIPQFLSPDCLVQAELMDAAHNDSLDITDLITVIKKTGEVNADWIIMYEFDVDYSEWKGPKHCVGLAVRKKNHYSFPVKVFLTDEGLKRKDEYVAMALSCVKYGDNPKPEWIEREKGTRPNELTFPLVLPRGGGLIVD